MKLTNVLTITLNKDNLSNLDAIVEQMENYMKSKGSQPIGSLIQYTDSVVNEKGENIVEITEEVLEEIIFRGLILSRSNKAMNTTVALIISS